MSYIHIVVLTHKDRSQTKNLKAFSNRRGAENFLETLRRIPDRNGRITVFCSFEDYPNYDSAHIESLKLDS